MDGHQLDLFAITPPAEAPTTARDTARDARATWAGIRSHKPCDECIAYLHANNGIGPNPRRAVLKRTIKATGDTRLLCRDHGDRLQTADKAAAERAKTTAARKQARR